MSDTFTCAACGGTFTKAWSEAEAKAEYAENGWGNLPIETACVVCDDCYQAMMHGKETPDVSVQTRN